MRPTPLGSAFTKVQFSLAMHTSVTLRTLNNAAGTVLLGACCLGVSDHLDPRDNELFVEGP